MVGTLFPWRMGLLGSLSARRIKRHYQLAMKTYLRPTQKDRLELLRMHRFERTAITNVSYMHRAGLCT